MSTPQPFLQHFAGPGRLLAKWADGCRVEWALWRLVTKRVGRRLAKQCSGLFFWRGVLRADTAAALIIVPQEFRTADAIASNDIIAGSFRFAGHTAEIGSRSPFSVEPPSLAWASEVHGFGWLRHLHAVNSDAARQCARTQIDDWIKLCTDRKSVGWRQGVVARRVLSWLTHAPLIIEGCDREFYRRYMSALYRQISFLRRNYAFEPEGRPRLFAALALCVAGAAISGQSRLLHRSMSWLQRELKVQILPDGGHISRNPAALPEILIDLLPIRDMLIVRQADVPPIVTTTIESMTAMLRFCRLGDGTLAQFNGAGDTPADIIAKILAHDDARAATPRRASHSGYQRLSCRQTVVIFDVGSPPPPVFSETAHAGCLAFEFTSRRNRIVVNCGKSSFAHPEWQAAARLTPAHSTLTIDNKSSIPMLRGGISRLWGGTPPLIGRMHVSAERLEGGEGQRAIASHDGYGAQFGFVHTRELVLSADGGTLSGTDGLTPVNKTRSTRKFAIRFHLHPSVKASSVRDGQAVLLVCGGGEAWEFDTGGGRLSLEPSIYFFGQGGGRRSRQIVIEADTAGDSADGFPTKIEIAWQFRRKTERSVGKADSAQDLATPPLPFAEFEKGEG